jgi:DNA-binding LacI/PurR family transcriptional regulator/DNA-binding transcriptional regulator YhcF (GntR family)
VIGNNQQEQAAGYRVVVEAVRQGIVKGLYAPGALLPTRIELESRFGVSRNTVQRAMSLLHRDGFIRMAGRRATYVAPRPPHLCRYALVFRDFPSDRHFYWTRYLQMLVEQAAITSADGTRTVEVFYGISDKLHETPASEALREAIAAQRLAGVVLVGEAGTDLHTRTAREAGVPCVVLADDTRVDMDVVMVDNAGFISRAVEAMAETARRGVAVLAHGDQEDVTQQVTHELDRRGIVTHRRWTQRADLSNPTAAANLMELLLHGGPDERPDGLIIADDNLVEPALAGLRAAGLQPGIDIEIVAHCNFPRRPGGAGGVRWLGYDIRRLLRTALEGIDARRRGETPAMALIPAQFEEELEPGMETRRRGAPERTGLGDLTTARQARTPMRAKPATLTPALSQRKREGATT